MKEVFLTNRVLPLVQFGAGGINKILISAGMPDVKFKSYQISPNVLVVLRSDKK